MFNDKMKRLRAKGVQVPVAFAMSFTCMNALADIKVSDVQVFPGYPWKEVAVGYTMFGGTWVDSNYTSRRDVDVEHGNAHEQ